MARSEVGEADDLAVRRWAHKRPGEMGSEVTREDEEEHRLECGRHSERDWAHASEAQAQHVAETWAEYRRHIRPYRLEAPQLLDTLRVPVRPSAQEAVETTRATIVETIEPAGSWSMPWSTDGVAVPVNPRTSGTKPGW